MLLQMSRHQHQGHMETVFVRPLALLRKYARPYALQVCYKQMGDSVFYRTEVIQRPEGLRDWVCTIT